MKNVDDYIDNSSENFIPIIIALRKIIKSTIPSIQEKISYGIPFYYFKGPLCYINSRKKVVDLGFTKGIALSNKQGVLELKNRKKVQTISFKSTDDINEKTIQEIILEAVVLNELNSFQKKMG